DLGTPASGTAGIANAKRPDGSKDTAYPTGTSPPIVLAGTGGTPGYTFALVSGSPPPGITLNANGTIAGTPSAYGTYAFTVRVIDSLSHSSDTTLRIRINGLEINTASLPQGYTGHPYGGSIVATGVGAKTFTLYTP